MNSKMLSVILVTACMTVTVYAQEVKYSFNTPIPDGTQYVILHNVNMKMLNKDTDSLLTLLGDVYVFEDQEPSTKERKYYFIPYDSVDIIWFIIKPSKVSEKPFYGKMTHGGAVLAADEASFASFSSKTIWFEVKDNGVNMRFTLQLGDN